MSVPHVTTIYRDVSVRPLLASLVEQFIDYGYKIDHCSKWTMRTRATHLRQFARFCEQEGIIYPSDLSILTIEKFLIECNKNHSESTVNTTKRIIKVFIKWLDLYKEIQTPVRYEQIKTRRMKSTIPRSVAHKDIMAVIRSIEKPVDQLSMRVMYEAGLRIEEVTKITQSDIGDGILLVHGKGNKERTVYISHELTDAMKELEPHACGFAFTYKGKQLTTSTLRLRIQRYSLETLGVPINPHQLRHSYAIRMLENGCDIVTIQTLMGHENIETTRQYLRALDSFVEGQYRKFGFSTD